MTNPHGHRAQLLVFLSDMPGEVVQNRLPPRLLHVGGVLIFGVKNFGDLNAGLGCFKQNLNLSVVTEGILYSAVWLDNGVGAGKVKAHGAVFGFHTGTELTAHAQVNVTGGSVPIIGSSVPLHNVGGGIPCLPHRIEVGIDDGLNGDFNDVRSPEPVVKI